MAVVFARPICIWPNNLTCQRENLMTRVAIYININGSDWLSKYSTLYSNKSRNYISLLPYYVKISFTLNIFFFLCFDMVMLWLPLVTCWRYERYHIQLLVVWCGLISQVVLESVVSLDEIFFPMKKQFILKSFRKP